MRLALIIIYLIYSAIASAQFGSYTPLSVKGDVPSDFTQGYYEKIQARLSQIDPNLKGRQKKNEIAFQQINEFVLDRFLTSGQVIFGDEITIYLNEVLDTILQSFPEIRKDVRIYTVRSSQFNAYCTNQGIIFVNLGLLAKLETEAQLAYILCHEIIHYLEKHVKKSFDYKNQILRSKETYRENAESIAKKYYSYSKDHEFEADRKGYTMIYSNLDYRTSAPYELLNIMMSSYLPFENIEFDFSVIESENLKILSTTFLDFEANMISSIEEVPDTMSTHPNLNARREAMLNYVPVDSIGQDFLVSKDIFLTIREIARFECIEFLLTSGQYDYAIYNAFILLRSHPNNQYLRRAIAYSVYSMSVYKNYVKYPGQIKNTENAEGELSVVRNFLKNVTPEFLNTLAVCVTYEFYRDFPTDMLAKRIFEDSMWELTHFHGKGIIDYVEFGNADSILTALLADTSLTEKELEKEIEKESIKYAIVPYVNDSLFVSTFKKYEDNVPRYLENLPKLWKTGHKNGVQITVKEFRGYQKTNSTNRLIYPKTNKNSGLGVTKALIITPKKYIFHKSLNDSKLKYKLNYKKELEYKEMLLECAQLNNVEVELMDYKTEKAVDSEYINDLESLQLWYYEYLNHGVVSLVNYNFTRISPIVFKHNTDYLIHSVMFSIPTQGFERNFMGNVSLGVICFVFPPIAPFVILSTLLPTYDSYQFLHVMNVSKEKSVLINAEESTHYRTLSVPKGILYNQFLYISSDVK